jgi:hypothetical protein
MVSRDAVDFNSCNGKAGGLLRRHNLSGTEKSIFKVDCIFTKRDDFGVEVVCKSAFADQAQPNHAVEGSPEFRF